MHSTHDARRRTAVWAGIGLAIALGPHRAVAGPAHWTLCDRDCEFVEFQEVPAVIEVVGLLSPCPARIDSVAVALTSLNGDGGTDALVEIACAEKGRERRLFIVVDVEGAPRVVGDFVGVALLVRESEAGLGEPAVLRLTRINESRAFAKLEWDGTEFLLTGPYDERDPRLSSSEFSAGGQSEEPGPFGRIRGISPCYDDRWDDEARRATAGPHEHRRVLW